MTVKEFIEEYKNNESCVEKHITATYIPYERKIAICNKIVDLTFYVDVDGKKMFKQNTPSQKMWFLLNIINEYTDIDVNFNDGLNEFNMLEENNVDSALLSCIPEIELDRFMGIMEMTIDDTLSTRDLSSFLETKFEALSMIMNTMMDSFNTPEIQNKLLEFITQK